MDRGKSDRSRSQLLLSAFVDIKCQLMETHSSKDQETEMIFKYKHLNCNRT